MALACRAPVRRGESPAGHLQLAEVLQAALAVPGAGSRSPPHHWKTFHAILSCRTERLGGHLYRCQDCGGEHFVPHSCRNRHCPRCQGAQAFAWLERQSESLLPVPYYHLVFTLPHGLNPLIGQNQRALYKLLFDAASATLLEFGRQRFAGEIGVTAVLHTWSQTLAAHYHLHCVVTGGGLRCDGRGWKSASAHYLFAVKALSKVYRAKYRDGLRKLYDSGQLRFHGRLTTLQERAEFEKLLAAAWATPWVVYAKKPFAGPRAVLTYLSRYTHRVALGNGRLLDLDAKAGRVTFNYKDYADHSRRKRMTLDLPEFLRRFALHILPERFVKIRHYGLLGNRHRTTKVAAARAQLEGAKLPGARSAQRETEAPPAAAPVQSTCPHCGSPHLILVERRKRRPSVPPRTDTS